MISCVDSFRSRCIWSRFYWGLPSFCARDALCPDTWDGMAHLILVYFSNHPVLTFGTMECPPSHWYSWTLHIKLLLSLGFVHIGMWDVAYSPIIVAICEWNSYAFYLLILHIIFNTFLDLLVKSMCFMPCPILILDSLPCTYASLNRGIEHILHI